MGCIDISGLTKDYGQGRGIFDVTLSVEPGETFGFAGINGAGKTTTIRHLMGFLRPQAGTAAICGKDCWRDAAASKRLVGYVPGEIAFPDDGTGAMFLQRRMTMLGKGDPAECRRLCDMLQLDISASLKSMSKGMKQKTALVAAFMQQPDILIMDEPTTGLDPLMRDVFIELLEEQKAQGHTIFMSSHIFEEMERTCDRVALIKDGRIVTIASMADIRHNKNKSFKIEFQDAASFEKFSKLPYDCSNVKPDSLQLTVALHDSDVNRLMGDLASCNVYFFKEIKHSLEEYFHEIFKEDSQNVQ